MASYDCSVDGWRSRNSATWYPSSGFKSIGSATGGAQYVASNPSGNNKYTVVLRIKTPSYAGISSISSMTVNFRFYKGNTNSGTLYGSLRTKYDDLTSSDTASTYRNNAIGSEASSTYAKTSYGNFSFTFSGTFSTNTYYYLVLYSKSNNDMFFTQPAELQPSATVEYTAKSLTVSYDANGGSDAPSSQTKPYGETITLTTSTPTPPPPISAETINTFLITGDANGGYFSTNNATTDSVMAERKTPSTRNYFFANWNTAKNGSGDSYTSGGSYSKDEDITLYAIYSFYHLPSGVETYTNNTIDLLEIPVRDDEIVDTYTISFNANGGRIDITTETANNITSYNFGGWATSADATSADASPSYTNAKTIYAYWESENGTQAINLPTALRHGYNFVGWATSADAETADIGTGTYTPPGNITLYAVWGKKTGNSLINYNNNGTNTLCYVYYNDNGSAVICNVYYNDNGTAVKIGCANTGYINQLPLAIDTDGSIYGGDYNGDGVNDGYKEHTYLSSGSPSTKSNIETTGFIPIDESGDCVIYLSGITAKVNNNYTRIGLYDKAKKYITQISATSFDSTTLAKITYETDADDNLTKLDMSAYIKKQIELEKLPAYFRICATEINNNTIISVNEEIV